MILFLGCYLFEHGIPCFIWDRWGYFAYKIHLKLCPTMWLVWFADKLKAKWLWDEG